MIAALINHLWQSTLFCGGAWLITLTLRANSAALRHSIWLIASLKFLVPFSLLFFVGSYLGLPAARIADNHGPLLGNALQSAAVWVAPGAPRATESGAASAMLLALLAVWLGGALFVGVRWLLAWRAADSIAKAARPAPGAPLDTRVTDADIEPAVARVFHPVVLLPAALLARLSSTQMSAVLAHEHEHIARRDNLKANAHRLVETLFWFHPAVWWIGRQMLEERERACDEAVLGNGHDRTDYAGGILEVCRHCRTRAPVFAAAASGDLTRRVRYILGSGRPASLSPLKAISLIGAAAVIAAAPLFAGAAYGAARRHDLLTANLRALGSADIYLELAPAGMDSPREIVAARNEVIIRNSTLRDMVALAYGVRSWEVIGGGEWMDSPRYVVRAVAQTPVSEPQELDPHALRGTITKLLASRFDLQVHVNNRCQSPCGRFALTASNPPH
jgi:beta-lactamase regulating signal transducer with metallopeptidase domain